MEYTEKKKHHRRYRSLFWLMIPVGIGTAWLLVNLGIFTASNLAVVFKIWPLFLIAIGLDFIFGRSSATRGATIGLIFVGFVLAIMYVGPSLGLGQEVERTLTTYDKQIGDAEELQLNIDAGINQLVINPLDDSNNIIEAEIWHTGDITFDVDDYDNGTRLAIQHDGLPFPSFLFSDGRDDKWAINLHPDIALDLTIDGGIGTTDLNLSAFNLVNLDLDTGIGTMDITLPAPQQSYTVTIDGGVGEVVLDIPDDTAIQLVASTGVGDVQVPSGWIQVSGDDGFVGEDGTWQTPDYDQADDTIQIEFDGGVGSLKLR